MRPAYTPASRVPRLWASTRQRDEILGGRWDRAATMDRRLLERPSWNSDV